MRRFGIFCAVACGLLLVGIGTTPSFFREISVGGGYGSAAQGDDPAGGIWLEDGGNLLMDGDLTVDGDATIGGTLTATGGFGATSATSIATSGNITALGQAGFGTASPSAETRLHVYQNTATSVRIRIENNEGSVDFGANDGAWPIWINGSQRYSFAPTLFGSQDIQVNGGDIFGPTDGALNIAADTNITLQLDADNDSTSFLYVKNGGGTNIVTISEAGSLAMTGSTAFSTIGTFAANDTTPSVAGARFFKPAATGHTGAVAVTALDDGATGQEIIILGVATNETWTLTDGSTLANMDGNWVSGAATNIHLVFDGTNWFEIARR